MSMEHYYVVARDSVTGTWFTVDMDPTNGEGTVWDNDREEWLFPELGDVARFDHESFHELSNALDELNAARKVTA